jgi:hypothetical protein
MATNTDTVIGEVILKDVRLSFAHIFEPSKPRTDPTTKEVIKGSYQARFLLEKGTPLAKQNMDKIKKAAHDAKAKEFGENEAKWPKLKPDRVCLRDGDLEDWDGYEGHFYLAANSARKPQVITNRKGKDGKWVEAEAGGTNSPYSGCYVNALVRLWVQNNEHGKRLNASLEVVQFLRDGEAFGAAPVDPNEKFDDDMVGEEGSIGGDDDDDDLV